MSTLLPQIKGPADLQALSDEQLQQVTVEIREELVRVLTTRPAHFASNLGVVELCLALPPPTPPSPAIPQAAQTPYSAEAGSR